MNTAMTMPGNTADMFLVHFFGTGLADDRYAVQRFRAHADGDIRPRQETASNGRRKAKRITTSLKALKELRPARTQIVVCTGLRTRGGCQLLGALAMGILCDRRHSG